MGDDIHGLIAAIYDTVPNPARWHEVLGRVAGMVGSQRVVLVEMRAGDRGRAMPIASSFVPPAAGRQPGSSDQILFARDGFAGGPAARALSDDRHGVPIRFLRRRGAVSAADRDALAILLPHIAKALELAQPLSCTACLAHDLTASLDWLRIGVCIIRPDRRIVAQNAEFRRQAAESGIILVSPDGRFDMNRPCDRAWFRRHIGLPATCADRDAPACCPADDTASLSIHLAPLTSVDGFGRTRCDGHAIFCLDVARLADIDLGVVSHRLALTGSESELVALLAEGLTNRQIAVRRQRSVETVNSQVKSLLNKAECANRTQLIRRVTTIGRTILVAHPDG